MVKMFNARRTPDAAQKKQIADSSKDVADIILKHLQLPIAGTIICVSLDLPIN
jgi:E3 ubiquitin-protein ligase HUWE1